MMTMFNVVELCAPDEEQSRSPCKYGNIVEGHACYCHADHWEEGPRKCPVWRKFGTDDLSKWHRREWKLIELPMHRPDLPYPHVKNEMVPCMPDDGLGGCPMFEAQPPRELNNG